MAILFFYHSLFLARRRSCKRPANNTFPSQLTSGMMDCEVPAADWAL
jgi:hypothetical protein